VYKIIASIFCMLLLSVSVLANETNGFDVRDPTTPLGHIAASVTTNGAQQFYLNSILISPQRKLAIINGSTLREGQTVPGSGNVKVQRISAQAVVLQQADQTWVLRLSPSIIKRH
jgi:MSHA biogenesis protein MshK